MRNTGITLIALVISIIILLILAGVSLSLTLGENGIIAKAKEAKVQTDIAEEKEKLIMAVSSCIIDEDGNLKDENLREKLEKEFINSFSSEKLFKIDEGGWVFFGDFSDYIIKEDGSVENKEDYSILKIGDYVNFPVEYDNINSYNGQYKPKEDYVGWRIIYVDKKSNIVKLVSAGIPLTYSFPYDNTESLELLNNKFLETNYQSYGFKYNESIISDNSKLKEIFLNAFTAIKDDLPLVRSSQKADLEKVMGKRLEWGNSVENDDLFAIPCNELNKDEYSYCWLSSAYLGKQQLWSIINTGKIVNQNGKTLGIRPVVSLKTNIKFVRNVEKSDSNNIVWDLK